MRDIIKEPGKFEGEPDFVPELWNAVMSGISDETLYDGETSVDVFLLGAPERAEFEVDADAILIWEDSQGFVRHRALSTQALAEYRAEIAAQNQQD